jgi:hypothetical protein
MTFFHLFFLWHSFHCWILYTLIWLEIVMPIILPSSEIVVDMNYRIWFARSRLRVVLENLGRGVAAPCWCACVDFIMVLQFYDFSMRKMILYILVVELIFYMMDLFFLFYILLC